MNHFTIGRSLLSAVLILCVINDVYSHSYHLGSCPVVEPMPDFNMDKLLGKWYVIQKTSTGSKCLTYNFTSTDEPNQYKIEQISEHPVLGLLNVDNKYHYTGLLSVPHKDVPSKMIVRFPLSVAGSASYTVFMTDYDSYAAIFTCQSLAFANRQSASILSRTKTLDKPYIDKIRQRMSGYGVDPYELSVVDQAGCADAGINISVDDETFSPSNIGGVVRKAGEKLGDGVEVGLEGAKNLYNQFNKNKNGNNREELIADQSTNDAEWLP